jgi:hypothetical protein
VKWHHDKGSRIWRLLDEQGRWMGSVMKSLYTEDRYYVDLSSDKWPYPISKSLGMQSTLPAAKKLLVAEAVARRITE